MRLPFENWIQEQQLPEESEVAFQEAVLAHKTGAHRAALLFSFVGMGLCLRRRLLAAAPPVGMEEAHWNSILQKLQSEDAWDAEVFDCTQRQRAPTVFVVEDHLREEMKYWKNRRNDCAHFKRNEIGAPHVEAFWLFLRSNLGRWVPNGSSADILVRLEQHFDANLTPPGADITPLIRMIPNAVAEKDLTAFFDSMVIKFTRPFGNTHFFNHEAVTTILGEMMKLASPAYATSAAEWIRQRPDAILATLRKYPGHVGILAGHPSLVRNLWRAQLFGGGHRDLEVYVALLRNSLIPTEEIAEAHSHLERKISGVVPTVEQDRILSATGFWSIFDQTAFEERWIDRFNWGNANAQLIAWRVANHPIDAGVAQAICETFKNEPYPFGARDALKAMLAANPAILADLEGLAQTVDLTVPEVLK